MELFTRLSTSVAATTDRAVARFENHEAIGQVALERSRRDVAEARAALRRHRAAAEALAGQRAECERLVDDWTRRAGETRDCLERRRRARERRAELASDIERHDNVGRALESRVRDLETALASATARHTELASRGAALDAELAALRQGDDR